MYSVVKILHVSCVALSYTLFVWRGGLRLRGQVLPRWLRVVPHWVDTVLLASALMLTILIGQYPLVNAWLSAKLLALLCYIALGFWTFKRANSRGAMLSGWLAAQMVFAYIVLTALRHHPLFF